MSKEPLFRTIVLVIDFNRFRLLIAGQGLRLKRVTVSNPNTGRGFLSVPIIDSWAGTAMIKVLLFQTIILAIDF